MCPLPSNPNDLQVLTPAHFLIGRPYSTLVDPSIQDIPMNRLDRFQFLQRLQQQFWGRWNKEYISELQQRSKWRRPIPNIQLGSLVLVKEDGLPPANWKLGRIVKLYPGPDNIVRVVDVQCVHNVIRRPVVKLCVLPVKDNDTHNNA